MTSLSFYNATLVLYLLLQFSAIFSTNALNGFSTKFIHRDSPESPFHDPSISHSDRMVGAIRRSMSRLSHFKSAHNHTNNSNINTKVFPGNGEYLMEFFIGTPPFKQLAIVDTGSDITWTQCMPCDNCFEQDQPIFNSKKSSTFRPQPCGSSACESLDESHTCSRDTKSCVYNLAYGDSSRSTGVLALETYTMGGVSIPNLAYGCSHNSRGSFQPNTAGIIGLGGGPLSLVTQLDKTIDGKFSYCLVPNSLSNVSSTINFGSNARVFGSGVVSTPLVRRRGDTFYYLTLEAISVGHKKIRLFESGEALNGEKGNMIIDSGTTLTILPSQTLKELEHALKSVIHAVPIEDPEQILSLCYKNNKSFKPPTITAHFAGGADVKLLSSNIFVLSGNAACLAMLPNDEIPILGNLAQMNFLIGYDLKLGTISFKPKDCSKE
ncbi:aspartic proteinase CDR1-like [Impatiens glandulifera]|uniref:aspartic proteinase CDR1-like n=1 Tax=Impatiens glandulifera TaxID=253017 RepID=UPI001FB0C0C6|nr:aspartic proteinase CDR1-like [Impatiens glandulifera]